MADSAAQFSYDIFEGSIATPRFWLVFLLTSLDDLKHTMFQVVRK